jgi:hypothetical protein
MRKMPWYVITLNIAGQLLSLFALLWFNCSDNGILFPAIFFIIGCMLTCYSIHLKKRWNKTNTANSIFQLYALLALAALVLLTKLLPQTHAPNRSLLYYIGAVWLIASIKIWTLFNKTS